MVRTVVDAAAGRVPVIAHVGRPSTRATARLIAAAIDAGAAASRRSCPTTTRSATARSSPTSGRCCGAAGETPLLAYTFPARTGNELSAEAFGALVADGLAGLKDSTSDDALHEAYLAAAPDAAVFVGSPSHLLHALRAGSRGGVAALANLRPELVLGAGRGVARRRRRRGRAAAGGGPRGRAGDQRRAAARRAEAAVAELMAARGARYPAALSSPLGDLAARCSTPARRGAGRPARSRPARGRGRSRAPEENSSEVRSWASAASIRSPTTM